MRRLILVPAIGMALALVACKREEAVTPAKPAAPVDMVSALNMNDPHAATQLTSGFYALEAGSWRWAASKFAVTLRTPPGASQSGAKLDMSIALPDAFFQSFAPMTLSAKVGGTALESETYTKPGNYVFTRDVPATALSGDKVLIEFSTDKSQPPAVDRRELALIVTKVGLTPK